YAAGSDRDHVVLLHAGWAVNPKRVEGIAGQDRLNPVGREWLQGHSEYVQPLVHALGLSQTSPEPQRTRPCSARLRRGRRENRHLGAVCSRSGVVIQRWRGKCARVLLPLRPANTYLAKCETDCGPLQT